MDDVVAGLSIPVDTGDVDKATQSLEKLATGAGKAENAAGGAVSGMERVGGSAQAATGSVLGLTSAMEALATSWLGMKLIGQIEEIGQITMRYQMLDATMTVMANNAGMYGYELRQVKAQMEGQGISALQASKSLQIMAAAHIDLKRANELSTVAMNAAAIAGIDVSQAMDNIVRGLASGETRILRHMGLMVNFKQAYKDYQTEVLHSTRALTADEQATVRMNATIEEGARRQGALAAAMGTAGGQMVLMKAQLTDLKELLGRSFNPALNSLVEEFGSALKEATDDLKAWYASGEGSVWANNMKEDLVAIVNVLEYLGEVFVNHIAVITSVGAAYAAFKLTETVFGWAAAIRAWGAGARAEFLAVGEGAIISDTSRKASAISTSAAIVEAENIMANARVQTLDKTVMALEVEIAAMDRNAKKRKEGRIAILAEIEARQELAVATQQLAVSEQALAISSAASVAPIVAETAALSGMAVALSAISFGLPIVIAAIAAFAAWVKASAHDEQAHSDDVIRASKSRVEQLHKELEEVERAEHMKKPGAKATDYISKAEENSAPSIAAQRREIDELTKSREHYQEILSRELSMPEVDLVAIDNLSKDVAKLDSQLAEHVQALNLITEATKRKAEVEHKAEQATIDAKNASIKDAATEKELAFENRIAELKRQTNDFTNQGIGYSAVQLKQLKEQQELETKIQEIKNREKVGKETGAEASVEMAALRERSTAGYGAASRSAEEKAYEHTYASDRKEAESYTDSLEKLREKNEEYGKSAIEIAEMRVRLMNGMTELKNGTWQLTDAAKELISANATLLSQESAHGAQDMLNTLKEQNDEYGKSSEEISKLRLQKQLLRVEDSAERERITREYGLELERSKQITDQEKLQAEASRMNKSKADEDDALKHLNEVARTGAKDGKPLNSDVYIKEWTAIQEKGHDAMAQMVSGMKSATEIMGQSFAHFAETGEFSFKKMLSAILNSIIQMESTKAFQTLFQGIMSSSLFGGGALASALGGGALGGAAGGLGTGQNPGGVWQPAGAFASGGYASGTQSYLVGENGPEVFTPGVGGTVTPNSSLGGLSSVVSVNVNGGSIDSSTNSNHPTATQMARDMEAAITSVIIKHQRPGGLLSPV